MATEATGTAAVLDHHMRALGRGDLDEIAADYTDDSILITPDGVSKGKAAIRSLFESFLGGLLKPGTYQFRLGTRHLEGEVAYVTWDASCEGAEIVYGTDTFVVRDGKIWLQTFAAKIEPR